MATQEEIIAALKRCFDPEIAVNIYDLGLIYGLDIKEDAVHVTMSLTSTSCPSAMQIPELIRTRLQTECAVPNVNVQVVWDPPWTPERISPDGRKILRLDE